MAMAQAADPSLPDDPDQQKEPPSLARETVLLSLLSYEDLFEDIDNNNRPQGDVRPRYLRLRAIRGNYLNAQVNETGREYDEFRKKVRDKILDSSTKEVQDAFKQLMAKMDRDLDRCSRALEQDSRAAQAPVVHPFFMNTVFRHYLDQQTTSLFAPNGELKAFYGSQGDPVSQNLCAVRGCEDDFFRRLILNNLLVPINEHIYKPCEKLYYALFSRVQEEEARGLGGRTLEIIVSALECVVSVSCIAGSVTLLYNLPSMKDRIIATTFLSLVFPYAIVFLSKEARSMFPLTAGYWAVMIVFITTSNHDLRTG